MIREKAPDMTQLSDRSLPHIIHRYLVVELPNVERWGGIENSAFLRSERDRAAPGLEDRY